MSKDEIMIRKNVKSLSTSEKKNFTDAVNALKNFAFPMTLVYTAEFLKKARSQEYAKLRIQRNFISPSPSIMDVLHYFEMLTQRSYGKQI